MYQPKFAYAVWPWGLDRKEQMIQALKDVKEAGFTAFESVESAVDLFQNNVEEFKDIISEHGVYPVMISVVLSGRLISWLQTGCTE